jgi:hypothetical protein
LGEGPGYRGGTKNHRLPVVAAAAATRSGHLSFAGWMVGEID